MKRYFKLSILFLAIGLVSCKKTFLDLTPPSTLTEADFYKTASDMNGAVIGIYSNLKDRKPTDYILLEFPTDNLYRSGYTSPRVGGDEMDKLAFTSENPLFARFWESNYNGIFRANAALTHIDVPTNYTAGEKEQFKGEAQFMRALFYFDLVRLYGDVPKVTKLLSVEESKTLGKASEAEIYALIVQDLKDAIELLPTKDKMSTGRANKGAAVAFLAKVYVYLKDWTNAKVYLDMLTPFNYQLLPNFASLWTLENENNNEVIFSLKYLDNLDGQALSTNFLPFSGVIGISPRGDEAGFPSWGLQKRYEDGDTRKAATITEFWVTPTKPNDPAIWYPYVSKFAVKHTPGKSGLDIPVLRYADLVLLKAEVLYRLNQPGLALVELNSIRERAFGDASHNYTLGDITDPEDFLDKLLLERRLEFAFENERWFDLVRTGRFMAELADEERYYNYDTKKSTVVVLNPKAFYKYFPIPQTQIEQYNEGVLIQNDGY